MLRRAESSNLNNYEAGVSAMDIDDIIQLPTHQIHDLMPMDFDHDEDFQVADDANAVPTVALPPRFILVKHHPHANKPNEIIPLDRAQSITPLSKDDSHPAPLPDARPWAPFKTYSDYEDLRDQHSHAFSSDCFITFRNHRDMENSLAAARMTNIPFRRKTLRIDFEGVEFGGVYEVEIEFRDPWQIMKQWVTDESLTRTDCPIREWSPGSLFISMEHITRGALLCPIFGAPGEVFYVIDCVDEDMFLCVY
ncbi:hypothetical protein C8R44DRAFT_740604 [Mycena epipterygia]|nr:hypothetical protein C8R44DRAFT_740604 [Mycena epipterygia]